MSERELKRAAVLSRAAEGEWTLVEAAEGMEVSYRQTKRIWKRYQAEGAAGLVREKYGGEVRKRFGPTWAAEQLASEDRITLGVETLRRWMLAEGPWSQARKRQRHRQRRERKAHFGELGQMDGSFPDWLEGRGPRGCVMNLVDDATGTTLCRLGEEETI